ncbi:MAG TPA: glycosyltransferase family 2 protein [Chitinophagaceae bacterium]|nr:glycosyltransferase family 2 protein [Chitinophagaceae bacterium]
MQPTNPLVSVIIPFFNEERFLEETVTSVLQQTYPHWEILLIDDGSSDNSTAIAKRFASAHNNIFYVEHEGHANKGLSATRNAGIAQAKGSLVALLDADDIWLPEKLQKQVAVFQQHSDVALLCEASLYWYSWQHNDNEDVLIPIGASGNKTYTPPQLSLLLYPLGKGAAPCPSGLMIKTGILRALGGFEASFTGPNQMYEDQPFLAKFYLSQTVYVSSACYNKYRQRRGSLVQKVKAAGQYDDVRLYFLRWLQAYIHTNNITNKPVQVALNKALRKYKYPALTKVSGFIKNKIGRPNMGR